MKPPPLLDLLSFSEKYIHLPKNSAAPGRIRVQPNMRDVFAAMSDPEITDVSVKKSARVGYSTALACMMLAEMKQRNIPILSVFPRQDDAKRFVSSDLENIARSSPELAHLLPDTTGKASAGNRSNLLYRQYGQGGILRLVGASPNSLRGDAAALLVLDETAAFPISPEGDPIALAHQRTLTFGKRAKRLNGSTPVHSGDPICLSYQQGDQRRFTCECPSCGGDFVLDWEAIKWEEDDASDVYATCENGCVLPEDDHKADLINSGRYVATNPNADPGHASFHVTAVSSFLISWRELAQRYMEAKKRGDLQAFYNVSLGLEYDHLSDQGMNLEHLKGLCVQIPNKHEAEEQYVAATSGVDIQGDRAECSTVLWTEDGAGLVVDHSVFYGSPVEDDLWAQLHDHLTDSLDHPIGGEGSIRRAGTLVDAGYLQDRVMKFTEARRSLSIYASKGRGGAGVKGIDKIPTTLKGGQGRLFILGSNALKSTVSDMVSRSRFSFNEELAHEDSPYFEQLTAEVKIKKWVGSRYVDVWIPKPGATARNETLDTLVYAYAAKELFATDLTRHSKKLIELKEARISGMEGRTSKASINTPAALPIPKLRS